MSAPRGKRTHRREGSGAAAGSAPRADAIPGRVPDLLRRALGLGFSGFFLTEEVLRKALGDMLPKEWLEFAIDQSERTRRELVERVAAEIGRIVDEVDVRALAEQLLRGHAIEVTARVRFVAQESAPGEAAPSGARLRVALAREDRED
jgi:hypothetical protein